MRVLFWGDQLGIVHLLWEVIKLKSIREDKVKMLPCFGSSLCSSNRNDYVSEMKKLSCSGVDLISNSIKFPS